MQHSLTSFVLLLVLSVPVTAQDWRTGYERSGFAETDRYAETVVFCQRLAAESPLIDFRSFGVSAEGRELPLLEVNAEGGEELPLLFIIAGIHPGEIDGKDAGLMLLRDAVIRGEHPGLLDRLRIAFVPILNVDGHERRSPYARSNQIGPKETGWRTTAQNYNLNRDWMKADAPEMKALLRLIARLNPDALVDLHVSDGADYQYTISYGLETHENALPPLRAYNGDVLLPELTARMDSAGYDFVPYVLLRSGNDIHSGWINASYPPRFSTGYGAVINRPFVLIETHSLKDYRTRVTATYEFLKVMTETIAGQRRVLKAANWQADSLARRLAGQKFVLERELAGDSVMVELKGVVHEFVDSPIGGGKVVRWGREPQTFVVPFFSQERAKATTKVPYGYVIPRPWVPYVEDVLADHGLPVQYILYDTEIDVETYRFSDVTFAAAPYEGRFRVNFKSQAVREKAYLAAGSAVILLDDARAQVAIHLLEPEAPDSFVRWGFFSQIFEHKEYMEPYVADTMAARMLAESPALQAEFNAKLQADSAFAASPAARYRFFFERSPYRDRAKDLYPIGRITTAADAQQVAQD